MPFLKEDLLNEHYTWSDDKAKASYDGPPTRRSFDRYNGDQVLYIINVYGSDSERFTVEEGRKIEEQIVKHLPIEAKSEMSVYNWLRTLTTA
ncbi:MAG: hypothetical protein H7Y42_17240 [Chitinophagaceae bacterium]|nr:hypothetical protein [Chitinophagaceae bacterium]